VNNSRRIVKDILWTIALFGLVAGIFRLWFGLGATTNLSDAMPWGLWKVLNMIAGVALATSGFTVGFLVYVLKLKQFKPLVKPAILVAFLGYGSSCLALLFDIGLPQRFWHPIVMWNEHSFLFEVFWCVMLYFTVTAVELSPTILRKLGAENLSHWLHRIAFGVVILGISLSSLHHSSLGSLFLVTPLRLHPLWFSQFLPWFFIISAMGAGMMFIILVRIAYAYLYDPEPVFGIDRFERHGRGGLPCSIRSNGSFNSAGPVMPMLSRLATIAAGVLTVYFILKVAELLASGSSSYLAAGTWESWLFAFELFLAVILPVGLVVIPRSRRSPYGLLAASASASLGLALNRVDVGILGYFHDAVSPYIPSLSEWALSIGVVAGATLVFFAVAEYFPIFDDRTRIRGKAEGDFTFSFDKLSHVWNSILTDRLHRFTIIAVFAIPVAWLLLYPPYRQSQAEAYKVESPIGADVIRATLLIDGNRDGVMTTFHHLDHQKRLGAEESCRKCHHISMPKDHATPCSRCHRNMIESTYIFDHFPHMEYVAEAEKLGGIHPTNHSCRFCHEQSKPNSRANTKECTECHTQDMRIEEKIEGHLALAEASSFQDAMHGNCIDCHKRMESDSTYTNLSHCSTCHKSLKPSSIDEYELHADSRKSDLENHASVDARQIDR
jgi:Ni/Fe-hydrogenase subunit HybB-like protein